MLSQARGIVLDGVQPAALDQPQINALIYLGDNTNPQTGVTTDPLSGFGDPSDPGLDGGGTAFFNVQAYLDTGASGILFSTSTAKALNIATEQVGGVPVIYADVGVAGSDNFNVSQLVRLRLAPYIPGANMDQFSNEAQTVPITTPYTMPAPASGTLRVQVGPYVPPVDSTKMDDFDQLIAELLSEQSALDVVGMPAIQGHVMVIDPSGVKDLGLLYSVLGSILGSIGGTGGTGDTGDTGLTDIQWDQLNSAGVRTYLYDRATAPVFNATRTNDPGIPTPQRHVALTYASFDRFTEVKLGPTGTGDPTLPAPALAHNPFIGKNPVALMEGKPAGDAPGITITRKTDDGTVLPSTGNWLLDTGAAASIISEAQAAKLNVEYALGRRPGPPPDSTTDSAPDTGPLLVDAITKATVPDQFTLTLGGIGGQEVLAGFWLDTLLLPTKEATATGNDSLNIYFTHVPVLVGNITVANPKDPTQTLTLDGVFGMNMLIESLNFQTDATGNITDLGDPSPSFFQWITFDEPAGELGLVFDPEAVPAEAPEPASLALLGCGALAMLLRRRLRGQ